MRHDWRSSSAAAAVSLAIGAAVGRLLLSSMNTTDPRVLEVLAAKADPLDGAAPPDRGPAERPDRLVIALIDGLGEAPFGEAIQGTALGAFDWRATVDCGTPSLSRPIYHVLLTGVPQAVSGIRNNTHAGRARADDVAARVRDAGGTAGWALETVPWFHDLFGAPEDAYERLGDEPLLNPVTDRLDPPSPPGRAKFEKMARVLEATPTMALLHFIGVDHAGHHRGTRSPQYRAAAAEAVSAIALLRDEQAKRPEGARTVWMIGADHGHLAQGGHGGPETEVRRTTWIGLWPAPRAQTGTLPTPQVDVPGVPADRLAPLRVDIPGVVPADRLATTFAAILGVPPPREALGEPLPLPDRPVVPSPALAARAAAVRDAVALADEDAHRALWTRAAALALGLFALGAAALRGDRRREKALALAGALLPVLGACLGFWLLGPGVTLSAIGTHFGFMSRALLATALGAAVTYPLVRRLAPPRMWLSIASGILPAAAWAVSAGSLGSSRLPDSLLLLFPATGLLPWGILAGLCAGGLAARFFAARRPPAPGVAQSAQPSAGPLRNP